MEIVAIDLFCGAGGLTRGFLDAGVDVVAGFDIDPSSKQVYEVNNKRLNGERVKYYLQSVTEITKKQIFELVGNKSERKKLGQKFLLAGCAPCQPFSMKNKNRGASNDKRRTLITYFANLVDSTKPDYIFMENVAGLEKFETENFKYFIEILDKHGYKWDKKIVNAINYGVPQNRKRFVLLAAKQDKIQVPNGNYDGVIKPYRTVADTIKKLKPINAGEKHPNIPNHIASNLNELNMRRIRSTPKNGGSRTSWNESLVLNCHKDFEGHKDVYGRMSWEKPAPTLTTKFFSYTTGRYGHPEQDRAISLKEGALLQSFPPKYIFLDSSIQRVARQIGNAVPPKMAEAFGRYFLSLI